MNDGVCVAMPVCSCSEGFGGEQCETVLYSGIDAHITSVLLPVYVHRVHDIRNDLETTIHMSIHCMYSLICLMNSFIMLLCDCSDVTVAPATTAPSTPLVSTTDHLTTPDTDTEPGDDFLDDDYGSGNSTDDQEDDYDMSESSDEYDQESGSGYGNSTNNAEDDISDQDDDESEIESSGYDQDYETSSKDDMPDQEPGDDGENEDGSGDENQANSFEDPDSSSNKPDYEMGGAVGGKRKRGIPKPHGYWIEDDWNGILESEIASKRQFQNEVHQILARENEFKMKMNEAIELHEVNRQSTAKTNYPLLEQEPIKVAQRKHLKQRGNDIFGQPIDFEYSEESDPYLQVPTSK